ncbi:hypothetical protein [Acidihalobacter prosperus]
MLSNNRLWKNRVRFLLIIFTMCVLVLPGIAAFAFVEKDALVVVNVLDAGEGALRQAILSANQTPGQDVIQFSIPGDDPHTIMLHRPLPSVAETVLVDGLSQPGASCASWPPTLMVELDGSAAGPYTNGLVIEGDNVQVRGLVINRFGRHRMVVASSRGYNQIECNFVGTDVMGTTDLGNGMSGIYVAHSSHNRVGNADLGVGNLISGNQRDGVVVHGDISANNIVAGNFISTDVTGEQALGNKQLGIFINKASFNTIGGTRPGAANVISGNG